VQHTNVATEIASVDNTQEFTRCGGGGGRHGLVAYYWAAGFCRERHQRTIEAALMEG